MDIPVEWSDRDVVDGYHVDLGTHDGSWFVCHGIAPYFCLEATSRADAINLAARAIDFYKSAQSMATP